jgi:hypothetical protein
MIYGLGVHRRFPVRSVILGRRLRPANVHWIREAEFRLIGHCRHSDVGVREAAPGRFSAIRASAGANVLQANAY